MEDPEQDGADLYCCGRGGHDWHVLRCSATLQIVLPGEKEAERVQKDRTDYSCVWNGISLEGVVSVCLWCCCGLGIRAGRHSGGRPRYRAGGNHEAGEGPHHQDHLQRRHPRQHAVELPSSAIRNLCKTGLMVLTSAVASFSVSLPGHQSVPLVFCSSKIYLSVSLVSLCVFVMWVCVSGGSRRDCPCILQSQEPHRQTCYWHLHLQRGAL